MALAASFLGGAKSRLLPASIPFRFFAAAALFHMMIWVALFIGADEAAGFRGGLGPVLASVHFLTLGVLTTTAIGAAVQLLPVATRRAIAAVWPIALVFWLGIPGAVVLIAGMWLRDTLLTAVGASLAGGGLLLFAVLLADNLRRAGSMPVVAAYGWGALGSLVGLVVLGVALAVDYTHSVLDNHAAFALAHMILGGFGFMGLLALGFSHVLVPMFALSGVPKKRTSFTGFVLATAAVLLGTLGALADSVLTLVVAILLGLSASAVHFHLMHRSLKSGMRKRLGLSFVLVRAAWAMLPLTLLVGLAVVFDVAGPNGATLFGFLLIGGWLLTFLLGILQRILPFLASMHTAKAGMPPLLSELAAATPLKLHAGCHLGALAVIAAAILLDSVGLMRAGAAIGFIGALAFALFTAQIVWRIAQPSEAAP